VADRTIGERPRRGHFSAKAETLALLKVSGNPINGLGETAQRRPSPFFWHPPTMHPFADLQVAARSRMRELTWQDVQSVSQSALGLGPLCAQSCSRPWPSALANHHPKNGSAIFELVENSSRTN
jgi:hypothetical protein